MNRQILLSYPLLKNRDAVLKTIGAHYPGPMTSYDVATSITGVTNIILSTKAIGNILAKGLFAYGFVTREKNEKGRWEYTLTKEAIPFANVPKKPLQTTPIPGPVTIEVSPTERHTPPKQVSGSVRSVLVEMGTHVHAMSVCLGKLGVLLSG